MLAATLLAGPAADARGGKLTDAKIATAAFAVRSTDNGLYQIDLETGVARLIRQLPASLDQIDNVEFDVDGEPLAALDSGLDAIGALQPGGEGGFLATPVDLNRSSFSFLPRPIGRLIYLANMDSAGTFTLYSWDPGNEGAANAFTAHGSLGQPVAALAFETRPRAIDDPDLRLFGLGGPDPATGAATDNLVLVDKSDGSTTALGRLGTPFDVIDGGLAYDPTNRMLWATDDGTSTGASHLFPIEVPRTASPDRQLVNPKRILTIRNEKGEPLAGFGTLAIGPVLRPVADASPPRPLPTRWPGWPARWPDPLTGQCATGFLYFRRAGPYTVPLCLAKNPLLAPQSLCWSTGDPHYRTFSGANFDFEGVGDFQFLVTSDSVLEIQTRIERNRVLDFAVNTAVAFKYNGRDVFATYVDGRMFVNSKRFKPDPNLSRVPLPRGGLYRPIDETQFEIRTGNGTRLVVMYNKPERGVAFLNLFVYTLTEFVGPFVGHWTTPYTGACVQNVMIEKGDLFPDARP